MSVPESDRLDDETEFASQRSALGLLLVILGTVVVLGCLVLLSAVATLEQEDSRDACRQAMIALHGLERFGDDLDLLGRAEAQGLVLNGGFRNWPECVREPILDRALGRTDAGAHDPERLRTQYGYRLATLDPDAAMAEVREPDFFDRPRWMQDEILARARGRE